MLPEERRRNPALSGVGGRQNLKEYEFFISVTEPEMKQRFADEVRRNDTRIRPTMYAARMYFHD